MRQRSKDKNKSKSWILLLLFFAIGLFIGWLILLMYWSHFFSTSSEEQKLSKQKVMGWAPELLKDWGIVIPDSEGTGDESANKKPGRQEAILTDGHGVAPSMSELLTDRLFDRAEFDARFESMEIPLMPQKNLPHSTFGKKVAYVYHSHNRESFLPYFPEMDEPEQAYHASRNITQVGKMLDRALENRGIGTVVDTSDIVEELDVKGLNFANSYQITREHIGKALSANRDLTLFLDIHRDSLRKDATTEKIRGQSFAQVIFVVGTSHTSYKSNLAFTEQVNRRLDSSYPGLSKGIFQKDTSQGNGVYNQDVSPTAVLIEVGGVDSTLEEMQRTMEALADALSEVYWHGEE